MPITDFIVAIHATITGAEAMSVAHVGVFVGSKIILNGQDKRVEFRETQPSCLALYSAFLHSY